MNIFIRLLILLCIATALPITQSADLNLDIFSISKAEAAVKVKGYTRKDGTYVKPHYRSSPDGNPYNNWSFPGNTNPYTGETATGNINTYLKNYYDTDTSNNFNSIFKSFSSSSSSKSFSTPTTTSDINCGHNAYYSLISGCRCKAGYSGTSCEFIGCPTGLTLDETGTCTATTTEKISCLSQKKPCKCPKGYSPMGNRICVSN